MTVATDSLLKILEILSLGFFAESLCRRLPPATETDTKWLQSNTAACHFLWEFWRSRSEKIFQQRPLNSTSNQQESPKRNNFSTRKTMRKLKGRYGNVRNKRPTHNLPDILFDKFSTHNSTHHTLSGHHKLSNTNTVAIEQNNDVILQQLRLKLLKEENSETVLIQDTRYQHYVSQLDRMSTQDDIVTRQYFDETGNVKYNQKLLPKHLLQELLVSLHGTADQLPGIAKSFQEIRCKHYYPGIAKIVRNGFKYTTLVSETNELVIHLLLLNYSTYRNGI